MLSDSDRPSNERAESETTESEGSSSSPWSVLSGRETNNSAEYDGHGSVEPIAIIGMSCRLPGSATDPSSLWDMLISGRTAWTPGPGKRFNMKAFQDLSGKSGTTNTGGGHFLREDIAAFDASFFGIHPAEAMAMDPQQRLLLEIAYESFQNAGLSMESVWGSNTGVYVGQWSTDYHEIEARDIDAPPLYLITGTGPAISSNRISYYYNLRGPSFTVDTGCSSSLVALHQAVQSLRSGESSQCFVGGVNLLLDPQRFTYQSKLKMFSREGRSFAFDSRANGYGRGEGCTGVVLKPLSAALRDGNHVRAVIRNSVLNQDGRTPGISVPSATAQKEAILKAYRQAKLDLYADYVEAHGTGTKVGDPIEVSAIAAALSQSRMSNRRLPIGSIKGNIGHTEGAAGLAGLIKSVLMLEHGIIPPQANYKKPNPDILLDTWKLRIPTVLERQNLRRISINSFGYGGTNAHVVLDSAGDAIASLSRLPLLNGIQPSHIAETPRVFFITGASEKSCQRMCSRLAEYLVVKHRSSSEPDTLLARLAYGLGNQSTHAHRVALIASNLDDLICQLNSAAQAVIPRQEKKGESRIALVFSGQGAQYAEMGRELLKSYPSFVRSLERARQQLARLGCQWDLLSELCRPKGDSRVNEPAVSQPASTAIQLSLVDLIFEFGVSPCAVVGHSSGEIAAAYAAKAISFEDAITAAYFRGKLTSELVGGKLDCLGSMLAVGAPPDAVEESIQSISKKHGQMRIACFNSPSSVTVSGDSTAIDELKAVLDEEGTFNRKLTTNGAAYHSHQMKLVEKEYAITLATLARASASSSTRMFSSVTGKEVDESTTLDGGYWVQNLISPVLFSHALHNLCGEEYQGQPIDTIVEVGPHSQLAGPVKQILKTLRGRSSHAGYTSTLKRDRDAEVSLMECLSFLHVHGASIRLQDLNRSNGDCPPSLLVDLPPYPFDHDRTFWHETRVSKDYRHRQHLPHELLGTLTADVNRLEPRWRRFISLKESPWLKSHVVQGQVILPAAGFITMAVQASRQHTQMVNPTARVENILFRNISIGKAIVLPVDGPDVEIALSLRPEARTARESSSFWSEFRIFTVAEDGKWTEHCRGLVHAELEPAEARDEALSEEDISRIDMECTHAATPQKFYYLGRDIGLDWQQPFDNITSLRTSRNSCIATARRPITDSDPGGMGDVLHPALLDSCLFHGLCSIAILERGIKSTCVPTFIKHLRISNRPAIAGKEFVCTTTGGQDSMTFDVVVQQDGSSGQDRTLSAQGVRVTSLPGESTLNQENREMCHGLEWVTYMDAWTQDHRNQMCKSTVEPGSVTEQNHALEALTLHYIQSALRDVESTDIPAGHRRRYFEWMQTRTDDSYDASLIAEGDAISALGVMGEAITRLGPHLSDILTQKIDPLVLLTKENLLSRLYTEERCPRCYSQITAYCQEMGRQSPGLKVLEIGAGTASATLPVLQALNGQGNRHVQRYDFTDVSPGFFAAAKERLGELAEVAEFRVLDVERDAREQGFEEASYDLIIACNVVHATRRINSTLGNIRPLLKPGGKFVLMELTQPALYYNLIFGVFEGWWAGYDEGRCLSPLLPSPEWITRLSLAGFANPERWFTDYVEADGGTLSVFISSAVLPSTHVESLPPVHIITSNQLDVPPVPILERAMQCIQSKIPGLDISAQSLIIPSPGGNIVVILPEIARLLCNNLDMECFQAFKQWMLQARAILLIRSGNIANLDNTDTGLWVGFARSLRLEQSDIRMITLELDASDIPVIDRLANVLPTLLRSPSFDLDRQWNEVENEFAEKNGQLFVSRVMHRPEMTKYVQRNRQQGEPEMVPFLDKSRLLSAELGVPGLLESLRWKDDVAAPEMGPNDVKLELRAASVNFKDVLIAAGQLEGITEMRNDCSGVVVDVGINMRERFKAGDRVCAMYSRSYTNYPVVHGDCCQVVPDSMSFPEAASLPIVWTTVYYSLVDMGRLKKGDKLLIHSAAGAVGQAAIILAQHLGADVFVTVGSDGKRDLLHETYGIDHDRIFSSRNPSFYNSIKRLTGGYGVDVVLNSLSGEMFRHTCNIVAPFGRFVEIGRKDFMDDALMPSGFLLRNITFAYVDLTMVIENHKQLARRLLQDVVDLAAAGSIRAVTLTTMAISEIETAFRHIQAGKHTGKIILTVEDNQQVKAIPPLPVQAQLDPEASYAIVGGLGGLGRTIISWLADHGAKHILCISRSGANNEKDQAFIDEIGARGVRVLAIRCDVASQDEVAHLVQQATDDGLPPVRGIIQSAMVLKDALFAEMTVDQWNGALAPKVQGTKNLHSHLGKNVDFFIVMSSSVVVTGNLGQCNYSGACSFQDALARHRTAVGAPAFSINVGPVLEVGYVSENPEVAATLRRNGLGAIGVSEILAMLNYAVTNPSGDGNLGGGTCSVGMVPTGNELGLGDTLWMSDRRFGHLVRRQAAGPKAGSASADVARLLAGAANFDDAAEIMCAAILQQLGKLIATPIESLSEAQSLDSYGVDSLVAVELRNWIGAYLQANVQLMVLRGTGSIRELAKIVAKESRLISFELP